MGAYLIVKPDIYQLKKGVSKSNFLNCLEHSENHTGRVVIFLIKKKINYL